MGFSLKKMFKKVAKVAKTAIDPLGINSKLLKTGLGVLGAGKKKASDGAAAPVKSRYKRKERNRWKSKRQTKFEASRLLRKGVTKK